MSLVEQGLLTLPEHLRSPPVLSGVRVTWSLVLYVCLVDRCLSLFLFSFCHCVVCSSSIYGFWLTLWYLQMFSYSDWRIPVIYEDAWKVDTNCWHWRSKRRQWCYARDQNTMNITTPLHLSLMMIIWLRKNTNAYIAVDNTSNTEMTL